VRLKKQTEYGLVFIKKSKQNIGGILHHCSGIRIGQMVFGSAAGMRGKIITGLYNS
jgi:hypothetical protein